MQIARSSFLAFSSFLGENDTSSVLETRKKSFLSGMCCLKRLLPMIASFGFRREHMTCRGGISLEQFPSPWQELGLNLRLPARLQSYCFGRSPLAEDYFKNDGSLPSHVCSAGWQTTPRLPRPSGEAFLTVSFIAFPREMHLAGFSSSERKH